MPRGQFRDRPNSHGLAWSERTTLHKVVTAADLALILCWAAVLIVGTSQPVTWSFTGAVLVLVLGDCLLMWKRLGELGRR